MEPEAGQDTYSSHCVFLVALKALKVQRKANFQGKQLVRLQCGFALSSPLIDSSRAGLWLLCRPQGEACRQSLQQIQAANTSLPLIAQDG